VSFLGSQSRRTYASRCTSPHAVHCRSTSPSWLWSADRSAKKLPHSHTQANENPILLCGLLENFADGAIRSNDCLIGTLRTPFSADRKCSVQSVQTFAASFRPFEENDRQRASGICGNYRDGLGISCHAPTVPFAPTHNSTPRWWHSQPESG
jgi:hypothetical protein